MQDSRVSPFAHEGFVLRASLRERDDRGFPQSAEVAMFVRRIAAVVLAVLLATIVAVGPAYGDVPLGPAHLVPCPGMTGDGSRYQGVVAPFRCHSAVVDPLGNTVVLLQGRSDGSGSSGFGWLHALQDHNVSDLAVERVVSSAYPITAPRERVRYIAELRVEGRGVIAIWVEVDRAGSNDAPDPEAFGVVTAYCKVPSNPNPENKCPNWVNDSMW